MDPQAAPARGPLRPRLESGQVFRLLECDATRPRLSTVDTDRMDCARCGRSFTPPRGHRAVYCSHACRQAAYHQRQRRALAVERERWLSGHATDAELIAELADRAG
jgi:hypothetical protein